ncbi:transposase [soil metagenome]
MTIETYMSYLLSSPIGSSCVKAAEVLEVSHDQVNRFLLAGPYDGKDLFEKAVVHLVLVGGTLTVDDSVLDKPYSQLQTDLITYLYSGKHHRVGQGIGLITLVYTDTKGVSLPVNFRVYDKSAGKTKNDYFQEMVKEVHCWNMRPKIVTGDSWYASTAYFKFLRNQELCFLFGLEKNRIISTQPGQLQQICTAEIPSEGLYTHLKEFDFVKVFQTLDKDNDGRYYVYFHPHEEKRPYISRVQFEQAHQEHGQIEVFHRTCKQVCNIERFFVRTNSAIKTHLFGALRAFIRLTALVKDNFLDSCYSLHRQLFLQAQREFITNFA